MCLLLLSKENHNTFIQHDNQILPNSYCHMKNLYFN